MQSKTSCFNGTLFRKNLTRFWPLWGLAVALSAPCSPAVLLGHDGAPGWTASAPEFTDVLWMR